MTEQALVEFEGEYGVKFDKIKVPLRSRLRSAFVLPYP
jgi:hypothetical protein